MNRLKHKDISDIIYIKQPTTFSFAVLLCHAVPHTKVTNPSNFIRVTLTQFHYIRTNPNVLLPLPFNLCVALRCLYVPAGT